MAREKVHIPEVLEPETALPQDLRALQKFVDLLDRAIRIPGTKRGIGLDAGLGLIPGAGDVVGGILSAWLVVMGLRHRVPTRVLARMVFNILLDIVIGEIPVLGDAFDFLFQENVMNMDLLLRHRDHTRPPRSTREFAVVAVLIIAFLFGVALATAIALITLAAWLIRNR